MNIYSLSRVETWQIVPFLLQPCNDYILYIMYAKYLHNLLS